MNVTQRLLTTAISALGALVLSSPAAADRLMMSETQMPPKYRQECASCHMAYPPEFLSKPAWDRIMKGLDQHYGTDASLDAATVQEISNWLNQYAGSYKRVTPATPQDRISTAPWFERKHRKITADVVQRTSIKSIANCAACHTKANQGNYDEDFVRIPK